MDKVLNRFWLEFEILAEQTFLVIETLIGSPHHVLWQRERYIRFLKRKR